MIAVLLSALCGYGVMKYRSHTTMPESPSVTVMASTVKEAPMPIEVRAIGTLVAARNVEISPDIPGHVEKILFRDGAFVNAGDALIQLNDAAYKTKF